MIKSKPKINLIIDALLMILLAVMAGLGFLIKCVLIPGFQRNEVYGSDVELCFMGFDRHQWGDVHLWVSVIFILLIIIHIILHWKMIKCIFCKMFLGKLARMIIVSVILLFMLLFSVGPFLVKPEIKKAKPHHFNHHNVENKRLHKYQ